MEVELGYKQTEVGVIPEDWEVRQLGDIGECYIGLTYMPSNVSSDGLLVLRSSNILNGKLEFQDNVYVDVDVTNKLMIRKEDILICVRNGSRNLIGKCALIDLIPRPMTFGAFMSVFRTRHAEFVFHQFSSDLVKRQIHENIGATINQITNKNLRSFRIPFPDQEKERTSIAAALSHVDALITSLDKLIAKKRDIKQAAMQQLLTGKKRLPGLSGNTSTRLGSLFELSPSRTNLNSTDLVTLIRMEDVSESGNLMRQNVIPYSSVKQGLTFFERNDVLVAKITPCFENGKGACLDSLRTKGGFGSTEFHVLRARNNAIARYIFYQTQTVEFRQRLESEMIGTAGQKRVPAQAIIDYPLPVYHSKDEQLAIATILSDMDAEIAALEQRRDKTRALKQGMMQELLTGKTRLV